MHLHAIAGMQPALSVCSKELPLSFCASNLLETQRSKL